MPDCQECGAFINTTVSWVTRCPLCSAQQRSSTSNSAVIDRSVKAGMYGAEFAKGRRAAKAGKSIFDCPYNGAELRDGWMAGFRSACK